MRNTIKAKVGYVIWFKKSNPNKLIVCDGNETVYPFDENRTYPMQKMEQKLYFKRY